MMDSPPKLTGETLIVHHIPLVHCQVPDRPGKRANPFCPPEVGAACTSSLPEWDLSQTDSLVYSSLLQASDTNPFLAEAAGAKDGKPREPVAPGAHKRQNPFLLGDSDSPPDFHKEDPGQKSFHLHSGKSAFHLQELALPPFRLHDPNPVVKPWSAPGRLGVAEGQEDEPANDDARKKSRLEPDDMELEGYGCPRGDPSSLSLEQEWADAAEELLLHPEGARSRTCSCSSSEPQRCRCHSLSSHSEPLDQPMGYVSDSSCNSSDGVLVNFSALYHKMNGHPHSNLNSANLSCDSSLDSHSDTGAFYLDLHASPLDSKMPCKMHSLEGSGKACGCRHQASPVLDANCNSYLPPCDPCTSEGSDLTSCFQSQARLVVATQNYYKLVTCDLSSQSSPSPAGSSITSCSEELTKGSPLQPTEYYLFQRPPPQPGDSSDTECSGEELQGEAERNAIEGQVYVNVSPPTLTGGRQRSRSYDRNLDQSPTGRLGSLERMMSCPVKLSDSPALALQGSPPKRVTSFAELAKGRKRTGFSPPLRTSRDSSLEFSPIPESQKDGSVFLEDRGQHSQSLPPMPLAHSLGHSCEGHHSPKRGGSSSGKGPPFRETPEQPFLFASAESGANPATSLGQRDVRARADGGAAESKAVVRYSKEQRPTTLPIQPFVFQHHFAKPSKGRSLHSHFASSLSQLYSLSAASRSASQQLSSTSQSSASATSGDQSMVVGTLAPSQRSADGAASLGDGCAQKSVPETGTRPSPLGSYSPVRSHVPFSPKVDSSSCSLTPESHPPRSRSCPVSANLLPTRLSPALGSQATRASTNASAVHEKESPQPVLKALPEQNRLRDQCHLPPLVMDGMSLSRVGDHTDSKPQAGCHEPINAGSLGSIGPRPLNVLRCPWTGLGCYSLSQPLSRLGFANEDLRRVQSMSTACSLVADKTNAGQADPAAVATGEAHHLSPQALKWREYRRRNPLGLDRVSGLAGLTGSLDWRRQEGRLPWRNPVFEFPGPSAKQLPLIHSDFFPDYFSLAEKPPAEFCLSPDGNTESVSIDLLQKKGLVKAINTAVDLIVAHFGTSRDPGVKAKLGNSSVSPNVGHLILKYLCPAIRDVLSDGLKAYVLDVIVGQRRNVPWSVVEASTQLGPSTRVLHGLCSKVSQYPELTSHAMRFNAFILGLLNIRSLEFWFNHLYNHEDIVQAHYQPVGFLSLSHGVCQGLFEEVLLLLQPLSLLPFSLDLLFEHHLLQMGREQQQRKELLRTKQDLVLSAHSTLQLMRTREGRSEGGNGSWRPEGDPGRRVEGRVRDARAHGGGGGREEGVERRKAPEAASELRKDKQASWWYQLMQSSQVYIEGSAEGSRFMRYERKKKAGPGVTVQQAESRKGPPPREGVVEGAEACPITEVPRTEAAGGPAHKQEASTREEAKEKSRPFWMGSPPDSVLTELKRTQEKEHGSAPREEGLELSRTGSPDSRQPKWGRLFGSRKVPGQAARMPSGWLNLDRSVFQLMAQTVGAGVWKEAALDPERLPADCTSLCPKKQPLDRGVTLETPCEVKALCHHIATEAGQLSFKKGDILRVSGKVDVDWLQCSRGAETGLVPIMYVTHVEDKDY